MKSERWPYGRTILPTPGYDGPPPMLAGPIVETHGEKERQAVVDTAARAPGDRLPPVKGGRS